MHLMEQNTLALVIQKTPVNLLSTLLPHNLHAVGEGVQAARIIVKYQLRL